MNGRELRERIEAQYKRHTGNASVHGAQTWYAGHVDRSRRQVNRWMEEPDAEVLDGPHLRILRILEVLPAGIPWAVNPDLLEELPEDVPARGALWADGFRSLAEVYHSTPERLLEVPGVGEATLEEIREYLKNGVAVA